MSDLPTRSEIEDFLFMEARLLDSWQLDRWADLFDDDGEYLVPSNDIPEGDDETDLFLINDDRHRVTERAVRLLKRMAHAEFPRSKTRHNISNVEVAALPDGLIEARCNFVVYRSRGEDFDVFPGHTIYQLRRGPDAAFRIRRKRAMIDCDTLRGQRRISIIL
jgi:p-cumate 2,3-dioxygenase beta subunit